MFSFRHLVEDLIYVVISITQCSWTWLEILYYFALTEVYGLKLERKKKRNFKQCMCQMYDELMHTTLKLFKLIIFVSGLSLNVIYNVVVAIGDEVETLINGVYKFFLRSGNDYMGLISHPMVVLGNVSVGSIYIRDSIRVEVPTDDIRIGDLLLILPGETIPVDAVMNIELCYLHM
ncbi:uncharacterized protein [Rutidosis leptorrhynchoides]|uniref:uncharacterized protein isoform X2 n=1 Tax=Rutidosis leptorrhynchoides TaxID=125765 RepID=UPI003A99FFF6